MPLNRSCRFCYSFLLLCSAAAGIPQAGADSNLTGSPTTAGSREPEGEENRSLPDLGSSASQSDFSKQLAEIAQSIAQENSSNTDTSLGHSAGLWAFDHLRDQLSEKLNQAGQSLLSPYGRTNINLDVDLNGNFDGTSARLLSPLEDNDRYLVYSQLGISQSSPGTTGSVGVGQRWGAGHWLFGCLPSRMDHQL